MKKLGGIVVLLIVLSVLLLPFATGKMSQTQLERHIASMNENPVLSAEVTSYERGWRSSTATIELGLSRAYRDLLPVDGASTPGADFLTRPLVVLVDITHGPIAVDDGIHFGTARVHARSDPNAPYMDALEAVGMPYLFEFRGQSGFGTFEFDADIPPAEYSDGDSDVTFSGVVVEGTARGGFIAARANMAEASFGSPFLSVSVENVQADTDSEAMAGTFVRLGKTNFTTEKIIASSPMLGTAPAFALDGLRVASDMRRDAGGDSITAAMTYSIDSVAAGDGFSMTDAEIVMQLANLDVAALEAYSQLVRTAMAGDPDPEAILAQVEPLTMQFLNAGPVLTIDPVRFTMPQGTAEGSLSIAVDASALPSNGAIDFEDPMQLLGFVSAEADATVSKPLAEEFARQASRGQVEQAAAANGDSPTAEELQALAEAQAGYLLVTLTGQGMLRDDGESYSTSLRFGDGQLSVNGVLLPIGLQ